MVALLEKEEALIEADAQLLRNFVATNTVKHGGKLFTPR